MHDRPKRALFISSPIGLGHAWRDVAIADELRARCPDLEIEWLAQEPVTTVLARAGRDASTRPAASSPPSRRTSTARPASTTCTPSRRSGGWTRSSARTSCCSTTSCASERYDLWIGDEAWEVDHFLHENPELKTSPYVWLTDFVGFAADARRRRARGVPDRRLQRRDDRAHRALPARARPGDLRRRPRRHRPGHASAPACPRSASGRERHYDFSGYVPGFDPGPSRTAERSAPSWATAGRADLHRLGRRLRASARRCSTASIESLPLAREQVPDLRMVVVAGPRIDPASLPRADGLEVHGYVHDLYRHLAACDVAVVQGGLTTTMELVAARRPFVYLPLAHHFEQQLPRPPPARPLRRAHVARVPRTRARRRSPTPSPTRSGARRRTCRSSREARRGPRR